MPIRKQQSRTLNHAGTQRLESSAIFLLYVTMQQGDHGMMRRSSNATSQTSIDSNGHSDHYGHSPSNGHSHLNGNGIHHRGSKSPQNGSASPQSGSSSPTSISSRRRKRYPKRWAYRLKKRYSRTGLFIACGLIVTMFVVLRKPWRRSQEDSADVFQKFTLSAPVCSGKRIHAIDVSYTLVTQLSSDRLWMMEYHCQRWGPDNPISIAILSNQTYEEITDLLIDEYHCQGSQLTVQVLDSSLYPENDYPVNVLRNLALRGVKTTHAVFVDVDFWESEGMYEVLMKDEIRRTLAEDWKHTLVIPAWQLFRQCEEWVDCRDENLPYMPYSLKDLYEMLSEQRGFIFDPTNKGGHGSTRYKDWLHQEPGSLLDIECLVSKRYEPFLVFRYCNELPPFQEQFTGYGKNKMTWALQLLRSGYHMSQVGGVYLVHYPHLDSKSRITWNEAPNEMIMIVNKTKSGDDSSDTNPQEAFARVLRPQQAKGPVDFMKFKRGQVDDLFIQFRTWLRSEIPDQTRIPLCDEARDDDSKLWISRSATTNDGNLQLDSKEQ